ncbi:hypothetical protein GCM10023258_31390 [Terrabacter aeriphilus]|uniref:Papain like cysteine protease AvrRpt2 n=1 Tax=Terrabacter aeriphilus TaxID=515662 RepID=A0ABP9JJJ4_9MICO
MAAAFHLAAGDSAPVQQTSTTCGSASLAVARMLRDPALARWVRDGIRPLGVVADARDPGTPTGRFAAYEQVVAGRTNAALGPGARPQLPWPRALGTPPWGARRELEHGAADPGTPYGVGWLRTRGPAGLAQAHAALRTRVRPGAPALLYVGNAWAPRHVVLVLPSAGGGGPELAVYEPSIGRVVDLDEAAFASRTLRLGGWDVPWLTVQPDPH